MMAELLTLAGTAWGSLAAMIVTSREEIAVGIAVVITLIGVRLCWRAPRHRMSIEERAKDGVYTNDEARRRIRFMGWFGPAVTIAGCALFAVVIFLHLR